MSQLTTLQYDLFLGKTSLVTIRVQTGLSCYPPLPDGKSYTDSSGNAFSYTLCNVPTLVKTCGGCDFNKTSDGVLIRGDASGSTCVPSSCTGEMRLHGNQLGDPSVPESFRLLDGVFDDCNSIFGLQLYSNLFTTLPRRSVLSKKLTSLWHL
mmetsp:Transcript_37183/g.93407  ORF Transcript_37183/g.93407 Transcript_37183/m.93407 type:complete len:152 (+) Transcript_37183:314-769(+)